MAIQKSSRFTRFAYQTFSATQIVQTLTHLLCPDTIPPSMGPQDTLIESQRRLVVRLGGVPLLSLAALITAFRMYSPPGSQLHRTTLWVFAGHNLLSFVLILKSGIGNINLGVWNDGSILRGGLHMLWLLIAVVGAFGNVSVDNSDGKLEYN